MMMPVYQKMTQQAQNNLQVLMTVNYHNKTVQITNEMIQKALAKIILA